MCGRFSTGNLKTAELVDALDLEIVSTFDYLYNVAPTLQVPAIRERDHKCYLDTLRWGLIPSWAKDKNIGNRMINARMESIGEKPSFSKPLKSQRCIIPASGFYEWQKVGKGRKPYYIFRADQKPMTFAGLWDSWTDKETGEVVESCTIVTREAIPMLEELHDRMPVILDYESAKKWLDPELKDVEELKGMLESSGGVELDMYPVSEYVSNVRNEGEKCIERVIPN